MKIYERQKEKGGIIDLEEESKKNLITEDTVVVLSNEIDSLVVDRPETASSGETNAHTASIDLDAPPGFESVVPIRETAAMSSSDHIEHPNRNRGRGGQSYGYRHRGRERHDYHPREKNEPVEHRGEPNYRYRGRERHDYHPKTKRDSENKDRDLANQTSETVVDSADRSAGDVKRGGISRGVGTSRYHHNQRGRGYGKQRGPRERNDRNIQPQGKSE
ncbi:hypothetical protein OESDEN_25596 [Oesophagostomum dentatum]|uniref:Uncharacterized protein n=1 Tax=Oesophagostomum dentatum TaxID=61180 RepID=A0A0B1RP21_OESDE|nr:hypothetical protein OESDEN_25596 [Oesophagostomum dentatum]